MKIIFVDDENELCEIFRESFSIKGEVEVLTFGDIESCKDYMSKNEVALMFIDYRMSRMNGVDFAKACDANVPKFLLTGELDPQVPEQLFKGIVFKPFEDEEIQSIINARRVELS